MSDQSNFRNVKLSEEFFHISFTPTNWMTEPNKCLDAMSRWNRVASETLDVFDVEEFRRNYSISQEVISEISENRSGDLVKDIISVLENKRFLKGPAGNLIHDGITNLEKIRKAVEVGEKIEIVIPSFAGRPHNPAAHKRVSPDLGEMYALLKLLDIAEAVESLYEPGVLFTLILDGKIYRPFYGYAHDEAIPYQDNLDKQISELGAESSIRTVDMWDIYMDRISEVQEIEEEVRAYVSSQWNDDDLPARNDLIDALRQGIETTPISVALIEMYKSGSYKDIDLEKFFERAESLVISRANHAAFEYTVLLTILKRLNVVQNAFPHAIRGTVHPKPNQYSPVLRDPKTIISPWHGTAIIKKDSSIVTEYEAIIYQSPEKYKAYYIKGDEAPFYYQEIE